MKLAFLALLSVATAIKVKTKKPVFHFMDLAQIKSRLGDDDMFNHFDTNGDGSHSLEEFTDAMLEIH